MDLSQRVCCCSQRWCISADNFSPTRQPHGAFLSAMLLLKDMGGYVRQPSSPFHRYGKPCSVFCTRFRENHSNDYTAFHSKETLATQGRFSLLRVLLDCRITAYTLPYQLKSPVALQILSSPIASQNSTFSPGVTCIVEHHFGSILDNSMHNRIADESSSGLRLLLRFGEPSGSP